MLSKTTFKNVNQRHVLYCSPFYGVMAVLNADKGAFIYRISKIPQVIFIACAGFYPNSGNGAENNSMVFASLLDRSICTKTLYLPS